MMNNILAESIRPCTGCGACSSACSTNAISIIENNEGFFSPIVDNSKCINCGSCKRVCYKYSALDRQSRTESCLCYATYSCNNHTHATTTSGVSKLCPPSSFQVKLKSFMPPVITVSPDTTPSALRTKEEEYMRFTP